MVVGAESGRVDGVLNGSDWFMSEGGNDSSSGMGGLLVLGGGADAGHMQLAQGQLNATSANLTDPDYYDYDLSASLNTLPLGEIIPVTIVYGLTLLIGVVGNSLVIFSIGRYRRLQNVTNVFLTSLASADLLLVLLCVPVKVGLEESTRDYNLLTL